MDQDHRDLAGLVGLDHVEAHDRPRPVGQVAQEEVGPQEAGVGQGVQVDLREEVGQRRAQIAFQGDVGAADRDVRDGQRIVELQKGPAPVRDTGRRMAARRLRSQRSLHARVGPQEGRDREAQVGRIVSGVRRLAGVALAHGNQRDSQPVGQVVIVQALDFVVGDELEVIEILLAPVSAADHAGHVPVSPRGADGVGVSGDEGLLLAQQSQGLFQRAVVQVARAAEMGIEGIALGAVALAEQIVVGVEHRGPEEIQGQLLVARLDPFALQVAQLRDRVDVVRAGLALDHGLDLLEQRPGIAVEALRKIVDAEELPGPLAGLEAAAGGQLEAFDQGVLGDRAQAGHLGRAHPAAATQRISAAHKAPRVKGRRVAGGGCRVAGDA